MYTMNLTQSENDNFSRRMNEDLSHGKIRTNDNRYREFLSFQAKLGELLEISGRNGDTYYTRPHF
jgi:hypothetical protein